MRPGSAEADREISFGAGADLKAGVIGLASIEFGVVWKTGRDCPVGCRVVTIDAALTYSQLRTRSKSHGGLDAKALYRAEPTIDAPDRRLLFLDPVEPWRESVTRMGTSSGDRC